jgi:radical SAM superfamily enzyme YgiQ (UPF0313 family)
LIENLDEIPHFRFWEVEEKIFHRGTFRKATSKLYKLYMTSYYMTLASRGCVFRCAYCCNNVLRRLYQGQKYFRRRSWDNLFVELNQVKSALPFIKNIFLIDDAFLSFPTEEIRDFSHRYRKEINLPLVIFGTIPSFVTTEKIKLLMEAGLVELRMGIQSGCQKILDLYGRPTTVEQIIKAAEIINQHAKGVNIYYDFILDNPFEKEEEIKETLRLLGKLPKPFTLNLFSLTFYPGTKMYCLARKEGILLEEDLTKEVFGKNYLQLEQGYYNDLFKIINSFKVPAKIWRKLVEKETGYQFWYWLLKAGTKLRPELIAKGIKDISKGDFTRIINYFITNARRTKF